PNMKTDELIALLSTNPGPVARGSFTRTLGVALAASSVLAVGISLIGLGFRPDLTTSSALIFLLLKLLFAAAIVGIASVYL
ncbi:NrsF family protein, partial [Acinetobacter baumannii]